MGGYTKLHEEILLSSVWREDDHIVRVWIALLALKDWKGEVRGTAGWLAGVARVSSEQCSEAIEKFLSPDPHSRSPEHEGRRIAEIDGGWVILNHEKYRDKVSLEERRERDRERKRRWRDRKRSGDSASQWSRGRHAGHVTSRHTKEDTNANEALPSGEDRARAPDCAPGMSYAASLPEQCVPPFSEAAASAMMAAPFRTPVATVWQDFRDLRMSQGKACSDWLAEWRLWLRRQPVHERTRPPQDTSDESKEKTYLP